MLVVKLARWAAAGVFALAMLALAASAPAGATAIGPEVPSSVPWDLLAMLALGGIAAIIAIYCQVGTAICRRRSRQAGAWLDGLDVAAAVSTIDGRIVRANRAAQAAGAAPAHAMLELLSRRVRVDAAMLYRIAGAARRHGLAAEPVTEVGGAGDGLLTVRLDGPDHLVWSLLPTGHPGILAAASASAADPAPGDAAVPGAEKMPALLDAIPVALMLLDAQGGILWHNRLAAEMVGRPIVKGATLADLVISLGPPLPALLGEAVRQGRSRREMMRLRGEDESYLQVLITDTDTDFDDDGSLIAVLSDASELRLLEDKFVQSQKMEAVGKLAGGIAHDFNNVLTAISGHSDLLLLGKDALHPDYSDLIQIRQNTHRAAALVRQLLAFSRKQTLNPEFLAVQDVVSDIQYLLNRLIGERVTLVMEREDVVEPGAVRADQQQLEQALMNLVVNARDAMPEGGTIIISTRNLRLPHSDLQPAFEIPAGNYVEIAVADEGTGIDPQIIDRVFEPFFTTKPQGEGTGLGLATVYGIVKQSGGFITAANRPSGGACFRILLPQAERTAEDATAGAVARPHCIPPAEQRDLTGQGAILLVEDEDPVRSFASRALRLRGYAVMEAASAEEAIELIDDSRNSIDLLISDVVMPGADGPTLAAQARIKRPGLKVIFISGYAEDSFRRNLMEQDFMFLPKPFSLVELTAKVKEALDLPSQAPSTSARAEMAGAPH